MTPEELIAEQDATITELRAEVVALREGLGQARAKLHPYERGTVEDRAKSQGATDPYWERVYDRIRAAWDRWALTELGTARPSHADLEGRPELAALWESVR